MPKNLSGKKKFFSLLADRPEQNWKWSSFRREIIHLFGHLKLQLNFILRSKIFAAKLFDRFFNRSNKTDFKFRLYSVCSNGFYRGATMRQDSLWRIQFFFFRDQVCSLLHGRTKSTTPSENCGGKTQGLRWVSQVTEYLWLRLNG